MTTLTETDARHLRRAFELAREAGRVGNQPFGAVLVDARGEPLSEGMNQVRVTGNITAHAESEALRQVHFRLLDGGTMYASGEPCAMCSSAMVLGGIRRIVFGLSATRIRAASAPNARRLSLRSAQVLDHASEVVELVGPVLEDEAWAAFVAEDGSV